MLFYILGFLQLFVAAGALPVGFLFIKQPNGKTAGMSVEILKNSPFKNFLIPGIVLFIFNGFMHLINAVLCFINYKYSPHFGIILGLGLIIWISVQIYYIRLNSFLQPVFFLIGIAELLLSLLLLKII